MTPLVFWALLLWGCAFACCRESTSTTATTVVRGRMSSKMTRRELLRNVHREVSDVETGRLLRRAHAEKITLSDRSTTTTTTTTTTTRVESKEETPTPALKSEQDSGQKPGGLGADTKVGIGIGGSVAFIVIFGGILYVWTGRRKEKPEPTVQIPWHGYHQPRRLRHKSLVGPKRVGTEFAARLELGCSRRASNASDASDMSDISKPRSVRFPDGYGGWPIELPVEPHG